MPQGDEEEEDVEGEKGIERGRGKGGGRENTRLSGVVVATDRDSYRHRQPRRG